MATKPRRTADDFAADMRARRTANPLPPPTRNPLPPPTHNTPGLPALSESEALYCEEARTALASLRKKGFDFWVVVARGLKALHDKADAIGGKRTYDRLREREGLGKTLINKTRSSRLIAIVNNLAEVGKWRDGLTPKQQFEWASPEAVHRHCPIFQKPKPASKTREKPKAAPKQQPADDFETLRSAYAAAFASKLKEAKGKAAQNRAAKEERTALQFALRAALSGTTDPLKAVERNINAALNSLF
jgi:hypothetical protein